MNTNPNQPDAAIDKTLAALNAAAPPEGMEARIAHRLAQPAPAASRFAGPAFTADWLRGAVTGAAAAMLVTGLVLFAGHHARVRPDPGHATPKEISVHTLAPVAASAPKPPALGNPCPA